VSYRSRAQILGELAAPLEPVKAPYYVRRGELSVTLHRFFPADGWYWVPAGANVASWLAATFDEASHKLRLALERDEEHAAR
jgi:hypothetical protein